MAFWNNMQQKVRQTGGKKESGKTFAEGIPPSDRNGKPPALQFDSDSPPEYLEIEDAGSERFLGATIKTGRSFYPECEPGLLSRPFIFLLKLYKRFIAPLNPPCCRFFPTCSVYSMTAYRVHGVWKGTLLTAWRVFRCSPLFKGGYDPVPPKGKWRVPKNNSKENEL